MLYHSHVRANDDSHTRFYNLADGLDAHGGCPAEHSFIRYTPSTHRMPGVFTGIVLRAAQSRPLEPDEYSAVNQFSSARVGPAELSDGVHLAAELAHECSRVTITLLSCEQDGVLFSVSSNSRSKAVYLRPKESTCGK